MKTFIRKQFETMCGFLVQGTKVVEAFSNNAETEVLNDSESECQITLQSGIYNESKKVNCANVLLKFENGKSVILPAIAKFLTGLIFDPDTQELVDVKYEPSANSDLHLPFYSRLEKLRSIRSIIAALTREGIFQFDGDTDSKKVVREIQLQKIVDPTIAIYASYAFRRQGDVNRIREISKYLDRDFGLVFFDIAMLAGNLPSKLNQSTLSIFPPMPLLTQGWAILDEVMHIDCNRLRKHLDYNSLWTLYDGEGANILREYLESQKGS